MILRMGTRGEAAFATLAGLAIAVGSYFAEQVINIHGVTFAAFNFGIVIGALLAIIGLVGIVRGKL